MLAPADIAIIQEYFLEFVCRKGFGDDFDTTKEVTPLFVLKDDGTTKVEFSASCPVDEQGNLLTPSDITISSKK